MKLTKEMWDDFLDMAVDANGSAGWQWFHHQYGFTRKSFREFLLENQEKAEKWDEHIEIYQKVDPTRIDMVLEENRQLREISERLQSRIMHCMERERHGELLRSSTPLQVLQDILGTYGEKAKEHA
jgi:hypothetical protein